VYGRRNQGRQRKIWINTISQDLISLNLSAVDVENRDDWRRTEEPMWLTPHLRDIQPEGERERYSSLTLHSTGEFLSCHGFPLSTEFGKNMFVVVWTKQTAIAYLLKQRLFQLLMSSHTV